MASTTIMSGNIPQQNEKTQNVQLPGAPPVNRLVDMLNNKSTYNSPNIHNNSNHLTPSNIVKQEYLSAHEKNDLQCIFLCLFKSKSNNSKILYLQSYTKYKSDSSPISTVSNANWSILYPWWIYQNGRQTRRNLGHCFRYSAVGNQFCSPRVFCLWPNHKTHCKCSFNKY